MTGIRISSGTWAAIGYSALVATAGAYLFHYAILDRTGAGTPLVVTLMIAPVAILLGATVRGETLVASAYAGFGLLAVALAILGSRPRHAGGNSRPA